ncbi:MAG: hypothetical protein QOH14_2698 [Pseudonocardiales bacterium]|jgi:hypothetical protein|nr:hypothetical protein [Pseudonocardiales bacterium]
MFLTVSRDPSGELAVRLDEPELLNRLYIHVADDVGPPDLSRALFESGAAVQSHDDDFLVSVDWLLRHAPGAAAGAPDPKAALHLWLTAIGGPDGYVRAVDAVRAAVVWAGDSAVPQRVFGRHHSAEDAGGAV